MDESSAHARIDVQHTMYEFWRETIAVHSPGLGVPGPTWRFPDVELMDAAGVRAAIDHANAERIMPRLAAPQSRTS